MFLCVRLSKRHQSRQQEYICNINNLSYQMPEVLLIERGTVMHVQYGLEYWKLGLDNVESF